MFVVKRQTNKEWARSVPAAAVIPTLQVAATIIGSKTFVACFKFFVKSDILSVRRARNTGKLGTGGSKEYDRGSSKIC